MPRFALLAAVPLVASCGVALAAPAPQKGGTTAKPPAAMSGATGSVTDFREGPMPAVVSFEEKGGIVSVVVAPPQAAIREPLPPVGSLVASAARRAARPSAAGAPARPAP